MRALPIGITVALFWAAPMAWAEEEFSHTTQYSHKSQFGVHGHSGIGYRVIFPYDQEFCGQVRESNPFENRKTCTGRAPLAIDLGASFGVTRHLEVLIEARIGLESDFGSSRADDGPRQLALAPGIKYYVRDAGLTKFFSSLQLVIDQTDFSQAPETDYGFRNVNGLQLDFHRTFGLYFYFAETLAFSRWLRFEVDAGIGLQARAP